jgi:TRAP-type C4-dicarboxylate transport system substrate-binding protein
MADVKGLKIRTPGGGMDLTVLGLGAVPIRVSPPEMYESMSRGTLDGALLAYQSAVSYHLPALLKSGTIGQDLGTVAITFSIGDKAWDRLPVDIRQVLADAGRELSETACDRFDEAERTAIDTVRKAGVRLVTLAEDPTEAEAFAQVRNDWASRLDARGKPGSAVLAAFLREAAAAPR